SLVGLLAALRSALGVERGAALRVAPAPVSRLEPFVAQAPRLQPHPAAGEGALRQAQDTPCATRPANEHPRLTPVTVITGFLGSGKTTLLAHLLRDPAMSRTAVIINEFGAIALDHDLVETSDESFVQLSNGCLCCNVRSDLVLTLGDLAARRAAGTLPQFERVVIETTGLADPAPILHALMTDPAVTEVYALDGVVTTVDAVTGLQTLERHRESVRQAAVADRILLTKTDVVQANVPALIERLRTINPEAGVTAVVNGAIGASALFETFDPHRGRASADVEPPHSSPRAAPAAYRSHLEDIASFCITRDEPVHAATLALYLAALAESCGADLLRVKGIVGIAETPDTPAVIHGVQHVYHAPEWLERWPSPDRRTRIVFIGSHLHESWTRTLLDLLDAEVADETARRG
ncbi:MAG: GTP-binding protein, partial [Betaproteobacteria bacterium]|nr:GTP-binding protein [Betaproteobacteria bacterium]